MGTAHFYGGQLTNKEMIKNQTVHLVKKKTQTNIKRLILYVTFTERASSMYQHFGTKFPVSSGQTKVKAKLWFIRPPHL